MPANVPPIAAESRRTSVLGRNQYRNVNASESIAIGMAALPASLTIGSAGRCAGQWLCSEPASESARPPSSGATTITAR